jgi:MFS family permease
MPSLREFDRAYLRTIGISGTLFLSYLAVAMSLPVVPVYAVHHLGLNNAMGGLAVGIAFLSTILTRGYAGGFADRVGGKPCMLRGLQIYALAGLICLVSGWRGLPVPVAYSILICGRLLLGFGESLTVVGMISWGIGMMGPARSGRVLALLGMSMYGAFAVGGPLGLALLNHFGFDVLMGFCVAVPLLGWLAARGLPGVAPHPGAREPFWHIIARIWRPGVTVGLQGVGFAGLAAFISLYFLSRGWPYAGLGLTFFGAGFVTMRLCAGHLPDRIGGTPVAIASLVVEAFGQYLLWLAPGPLAALLGALLTGLGCSMVFPAMGVEVIKLVPPQQRGTAMGGFAAFQDLAYGATGPVAGLIADHAGYASVSLIGGIAATLGLGMAIAAHRALRTVAVT